jgi:MFS family permease
MSKINGLTAYWMFFIVSIFLLYIMGLQVSPSVMAVDLMNDLSINSEGLGLLSGFFYYSYTLMQIPSGLLYDRFNAKWIVTIACLICAIGALIFGLTEEIFYASLARLLLGFGSSFAFVGALVISARWFYPSWFAGMAGATQFLAGFGALVGAYPLAYVVSIYGWRASLIALGFFGIILSVLCAIFIKNHPDSQAKVEHPKGLSVLQSLKLLITEKQNIYGAIYSFCTWGPVLVFAGLWGIPFFSNKYAISTTESAFLVSMIWIGVAITSPLHGLISDYIQRRKILLVGSALIGIGSSMILIYGPTLSPFVIGLFLFLFGLASAAQILAFALIKENNRPSVIATGMGFNNMAVVLGGAVLQPLVGYLMHQAQPFVEAEYSLFAYEFSLSIVPICFFVATIVAIFFIKETHCKQKFDPLQDHML